MFAMWLNGNIDTFGLKGARVLEGRLQEVVMLHLADVRSPSFLGVV